MSRFCSLFVFSLSISIFLLPLCAQQDFSLNPSYRGENRFPGETPSLYCYLDGDLYYLSSQNSEFQANGFIETGVTLPLEGWQLDLFYSGCLLNYSQDLPEIDGIDYILAGGERSLYLDQGIHGGGLMLESSFFGGEIQVLGDEVYGNLALTLPLGRSWFVQSRFGKEPLLLGRGTMFDRADWRIDLFESSISCGAGVSTERWEGFLGWTWSRVKNGDPDVSDDEASWLEWDRESLWGMEGRAAYDWGSGRLSWTGRAAEYEMSGAWWYYDGDSKAAFLFFPEDGTGSLSYFSAESEILWEGECWYGGLSGSGLILPRSEENVRYSIPSTLLGPSYVYKYYIEQPEATLIVGGPFGGWEGDISDFTLNLEGRCYYIRAEGEGTLKEVKGFFLTADTAEFGRPAGLAEFFALGLSAEVTRKTNWGGAFVRAVQWVPLIPGVEGAVSQGETSSLSTGSLSDAGFFWGGFQLTCGLTLSL